MAFVETVACKLGHEFENPCCKRIVDTLFYGALDKIGLVFIHDLWHLFSHRLAKIIRLGKRKAAHDLGYLQ